MSLDSKEGGLTDFARSDRPPIAIPFLAFRVMVGCGLGMLLVAWGGTLLSLKEHLLRRRALLWTVFMRSSEAACERHGRPCMARASGCASERTVVHVCDAAGQITDVAQCARFAICQQPRSEKLHRKSNLP
ncbi:cytochrome ubiquinol oxidase subunit I [Burkholderia sp. MR1-5-21]